MTTLAYSHTLVAGTPENINDVQDMFNDIRTAFNGNIDATNLATTAKPATLMGAFRTVGQTSASVVGGTAAGTYYVAGVIAIANGAITTSPPAIVPVIGADHFVSGLTSQYRVEAAWITNATAPAVTLTLGLYPITSTAGSAGGNISITLGTVVSGSTVALTTPAASSNGTVASSDFTLSSSGVYLLGWVNSGTTAANALVSLGLTLRVHNV